MTTKESMALARHIYEFCWQRGVTDDMAIAEISSILDAAKRDVPEVVREALEVLKKVAACADNEGTDTPMWFVVDPKQNMKCSLATAASQFVGPFFSRENAEAYLSRRRYEYGDKAAVWCASAYYASNYKKLYRQSKALEALKGEGDND